jgi:lipoprotein-anchoring transpeptidase ErfK/SrfK
MARWITGGVLCAAALVGAVAAVHITRGTSHAAGAGFVRASVLAPSGSAVAAQPSAPTPAAHADSPQDAAAQDASPPEPTSGWVATLVSPTQWSVTPGAAGQGNLATTNPFGGPDALAVVGLPNGDGWLHVELPVHPNGTTGWIPASAATLTWTPYSIQVSLAARTLTVLDGDDVVVSSPVAVGAPSTPTPPDHTYVWELVQPEDQNGDYGPDIFGLAEFSDAYAIFNGGDAQIGVHGTNEPWTIGEAASNGCVRLPDSVVRQLVGLLPLGTPVTIS